MHPGQTAALDDRAEALGTLGMAWPGEVLSRYAGWVAKSTLTPRDATVVAA